MNLFLSRGHLAAAVGLSAVVAVMVVLLVPVTFAAFSDTTENAGDTWATGQWMAPPGTQLFGHTGGTQSFTVPMGYTTITVEAWGAQGGGSGGGAGGYVRTQVPVTPYEQLQLRVGGRPGGQSGGYNGGGGGGNGGSILFIGNFAPGGGGGGASDVRRGGTGLANRVAVAGGGGGASSGSGGHGGAVGSGGGSLGAGDAGGNGGLLSGLLCAGGGGGGGGYYGGGGGNPCNGGAGGSNLAGGTPTADQGGVRSGHGQVRITWGQ